METDVSLPLALAMCKVLRRLFLKGGSYDNAVENQLRVCFAGPYQNLSLNKFKPHYITCTCILNVIKLSVCNAQVVSQLSRQCTSSITTFEPVHK